MAVSNQKHPTRVQLFDNSLLERSTLTPFPLFLSVWSALLLCLAIRAASSLPPAEAVGLTLAGFATWTVVEYLAHRFVFHLAPRSTIGRRLVFLLHENHHADPTDPMRSLMPLTVSIPIGFGVVSGLWFLAGAPGLAASLGFVAGYVFYDAIHWACHQLPMRGGLLLRLKRHHLRHHYGDQDANYAVTAIFLDRLFGSAVKRR